MSDKYYDMLIAELEANLEDRERTIGAQTSELVAYERRVNECDATIVAQHDTIERLEAESEMLKELLSEKGQTQQEAMLRFQQARIVELEAENARYRLAIDAALRISQQGMEAQRRIVELDAQLAAALATIEAAAQQPNGPPPRLKHTLPSKIRSRASGA